MDIIHPCAIWISLNININFTQYPSHLVIFGFHSISISISLNPFQIWTLPAHEYIHTSSWVTPVSPQSSATKVLLLQMGAGSFR